MVSQQRKVNGVASWRSKICVLFPEAQTQWEQKKSQLQSGNHARDRRSQTCCRRCIVGVCVFMNSGKRGRVKLMSRDGVAKSENAEVKE